MPAARSANLCPLIALSLLASFSPAAEPLDAPLPAGAALRLGSTRLRHPAWVQSVSLSSDSRRVASADSDQTVRIWEVATGKLLRQLPEKAGSLVRFSPTDDLAATGGYYAGQITLWNPTTGERLRELKQNARSVAFSADGKRLVAAGSDGVVRLWNVSDGEMIREFKGHKGGLFAVAISHDGRTIASGGGGDGTTPQANEVRLWNAETGDLSAELHEDEGELKGLKGWIYDLDFSPDDKTLAVATPYAVRIWDVARRKQLHRLERSAYTVRFAPDEDRLAVAGNFVVYDASEAAELVTLEGDLRETQTTCLDYSPSGAHLVTGDHKGRVRLWDARRGEEILRDGGHRQAVTAVAVSPDGSVVASLSRGDSTLRVWGMKTGAQLRAIDVEWAGSDVWWNREGWELFFPSYGREIVTWSYSGVWHFYELATRDHRTLLGGGGGIKTSPDGGGTIVGGTLSADGNIAAVVEYGGSKPKIRIYELDGEKLLHTIDIFAGVSSSDPWISALALSPDAKTLAVGLRLRDEVNDTICLLSVATGKELRRFRRDPNAPGRLAFSPDGKLLASSATGYTPVQVWRVEDGKELHRFNNDDKNRSWYDWSPAVFSPDGRTLATATQQHEIIVWELATERAAVRYKGHTGPVHALAFSPDGRRLVSGSADTTVLVWELEARKAASAKLDSAKLAALWGDLAGNDAELANSALAAMALAPETSLEFVRGQLKSVADPDPKQLPKLIEALDDTDEERRREAINKIKQFGAKASPALFKALQDAPPRSHAEIEGLLAAIDEFPVAPQQLQRSRAIQLLERIASDDAVTLLQSLAKAEPASETSRAALAALDRLRRVRRAPKSYVAPEEDR